jgi:hypothetical protein
MESGEVVRSARAELRSLALRRRALLAESGLVIATAGLLVAGAGGLDAAPADLRFLFLAGTGLFSLAAIHWVDELAEILGAECPRCAERFFAAARRLPSPLRRRCTHCGVALEEPADGR